MNQMKNRYRAFEQGWGVYYAFDNQTRNSESLKTRNKAEAGRLVHAKKTWPKVVYESKQAIKEEELQRIVEREQTSQMRLPAAVCPGSPWAQLEGGSGRIRQERGGHRALARRMRTTDELEAVFVFKVDCVDASMFADNAELTKFVSHHLGDNKA
ncbi:MAG: hypothetical protein HY674_03340 [Chloroflexi bacterium]|nr:hypothetical protein [Chloroflexota bacterium]